MSQTAINLRWTALDVVLDTNTQMHIAHETQSVHRGKLDKFMFLLSLLDPLGQAGTTGSQNARGAHILSLL